MPFPVTSNWQSAMCTTAISQNYAQKQVRKQLADVDSTKDQLNQLTEVRHRMRFVLVVYRLVKKKFSCSFGLGVF